MRVRTTNGRRAKRLCENRKNNPGLCTDVTLLKNPRGDFIRRVVRTIYHFDQTRVRTSTTWRVVEIIVRSDYKRVWTSGSLNSLFKFCDNRVVNAKEERTSRKVWRLQSDKDLYGTVQDTNRWLVLDTRGIRDSFPHRDLLWRVCADASVLLRFPRRAEYSVTSTYGHEEKRMFAHGARKFVRYIVEVEGPAGARLVHDDGARSLRGFWSMLLLKPQRSQND